MFVRSSTSRLLLSGAGLFGAAAVAFLLVADRPEAAGRRTRETAPVAATTEPALSTLAAEPLAFPLIDASTSDVSAPPELATGPRTSDAILVERLAILGANPELASAAGRVLADSLRLQQPADVQDVVASLNLAEPEARKAGILMTAYLGGEPLSVLGLESAGIVRDRALGLVAQGMDPDVAAWSVQNDDVQRAGEGFRELQGIPGDDQAPPVGVTAICKSCPMFDYGVFTPTTTWRTHSGTIAAGDCRIYKFTLLANRTYSFSFCEGGGTAAFDTVLTAWSFNCTQIAQNDDTCGRLSALSITNGPATSYAFVRVSSNAGTGAYTLAYRETASTAPSCKTCPNYDVSLQAQPYWQTVSGTVQVNGCVLYRVPVLVNHNYRFSFCNGGGDASFDTVIETYRGNCMPGPSNDDSCGLLSEVDFFSNTSQYVYVKVRGFGGEGGTFTLAYADLPTDCVSCGNYNFGTITPSTTPATHSSSLATSSACKVYAFNLVGGRVYRFTTCELGGTATFNTTLTLTDSGCNVIDSNDDAAGCGPLSRITIQAPYTGVYYLSVGSADGSTGTYTLAHVEVCRPCPDAHGTLAAPTMAFQYQSGSIERNGCRIYKVNLTSGVQYRFSTCPAFGGGAASFDTRLGLFDASCTLVAGNNDGPGACPPTSTFLYTATTTGTYYVGLDGVGTASGTFTLAYRRF